ncbi:KTSC domain-containing protein [Xanthobacter oligotrophicus]|uniref:KTSC domain-containing protein n=1 Tax=Xanthobacter oligotrophicus TaxID=2607286 RepID=A0ABW7A017_9HYPH
MDGGSSKLFPQCRIAAAEGKSALPHFNSTAISRAEYNPKTRVLSIWFTDGGGPYDYDRVPLFVYEGLCRAGSKRSFFNTYILDQYAAR